MEEDLSEKLRKSEEEYTKLQNELKIAAGRMKEQLKMSQQENEKLQHDFRIATRDLKVQTEEKGSLEKALAESQSDLKASNKAKKEL